MKKKKRRGRRRRRGVLWLWGMILLLLGAGILASMVLPHPGAAWAENDGPFPGNHMQENWALMLVSPEHPLPENYEPPERTDLSGGQSVDSRIAEDLTAMLEDARTAGKDPLICSSFRTWDYQENLFRQKVQACRAAGDTPAEAEANAAKWVARPGTSEHQTGLAVDIVDRAYQVLDDAQEQTAAQQWLMAHCAEYGFILRYPKDKTGITGIGYEPWHYRYVGRDAAKTIMTQGLCLEEYLK